MDLRCCSTMRVSSRSCSGSHAAPALTRIAAHAFGGALAHVAAPFLTQASRFERSISGECRISSWKWARYVMRKKIGAVAEFLDHIERKVSSLTGMPRTKRRMEPINSSSITSFRPTCTASIRDCPPPDDVYPRRRASPVIMVSAAACASGIIDSVDIQEAEGRL